MLKSPLKGLRRFLLGKNGRNGRLLELCKKYRNSPHRILPETGKNVADTWLELRYGLAPLLYTIEDVMKYIGSHTPPKVGAIYSKKASREFSDKGDLTRVRMAAMETNGNWKHTTKCRARVYYRFTSEQTSGQTYGSGIEYLPKLAWDLTRLSFVVDWIFTIGPWLDTLRINPNILILGATYSEEDKYSSSFGEFQGRTDLPGSYTLSNAEGGQGSYEMFSYERVIVEKCPQAPQFRWADALSITHALDAAALILQPLLKKMR
jgi:hypothetical protein